MGEDRRRPHPPPTVKGYENPAFLKSRDARAVRILCEYLEPLQRLHKAHVHDTIVMFGSARARPRIHVEEELRQVREEAAQYGRKVPRELSIKREQLRWALEMSRYYEETVELSRLLTEWASTLGPGRRFVVCSGGGPGIMEAANRGATEAAGGVSIGLTISLPGETEPNPFITPELALEFHYFFMRKLWFMYMAAALVTFPGGFGTMDELFEVLTLRQTRKIHRPLPVILYGKRFWREVINFDALVRWGTISRDDLDFHVCDRPRDAFEYLRRQLTRYYPQPMRNF
jgi:uncharacterized protein (TIGR00730 family)